MLSFSVSDIKMEEGMFINLVEKHEELTDKKTKKAEQKSILKNDYHTLIKLYIKFQVSTYSGSVPTPLCLQSFFQGV